MKKLFLSILFFFVLAATLSQAGPIQQRILMLLTTQGAAKAVFTDDFSVDISGRWTNLTGTSLTYDGVSDNVDMTGTGVNLYNTAVNTISQYVAALVVADSEIGRFNGVYLRQVAIDATGTQSYTFRRNKDDDLSVRHCDGSSCTDIGGMLDPGVNQNDGDSIGIEVTGAGSATQWKLWWWDAQSPPSRESWGTCIWGKYISGQTATTCSSSNESVSDLGANYADSGKYVGLYDGGGTGTTTWDDWMAGDI